MYRSEAHRLMLTNLKFLELQDKLLRRFQIFKNEEIRILKKDNMKVILHEWAKELIEKNNQQVNITHIPKEVLEKKIVGNILKNDIECNWLVRRIILTNSNIINDSKTENDRNHTMSTEELHKKDELFFDEYPDLFHYEYPQYPYNYYNKKKMTQLYGLIKFPYNDIMNISKRIPKAISEKENTKNREIEKEEKETTMIDGYNMNYSENNYIYSASEMDTAKEKYS